MQLELNNTTLRLLPQKAVLLEEASILIVADIHLGKAAHFRKAGIFMPAAGAGRDLSLLGQLIDACMPREVWFLGDLFHSDYNLEWLQLQKFTAAYAGTRFVLIRGNHDILDAGHYEAAGIVLQPRPLAVDGLLCSHEPLHTVPPGMFNIAGHVHPGFLWQGRGRQSLRLPCFYLLDNTLLLPAFGTLTGLRLMERNPRARIFAVTPDQVMALG